MKFRFLLMAVLCVFVAASAGAGSSDIPRILLVGDSWPGFMQILRSFDTVIQEYPNLAGYGQRGSRTCEIGVMADEFDTPSYLDVVREELLTYPTIDIVHVSLGGNDFLHRSNWSPSMPPEQLQAFVDDVNAHLASVIDFILSVRPNIRVGLCGYDFAHHTMGGATSEQVNAVWAQYEQSKLALVQGNPRAFYIHNLGLMQYHYGITEATPPIPAHSVPLPGGYAQNYVPMPGGNPAYFTPLSALMDKDIHLTMEGYDILARRCIDEFYGEWMSWPAVMEILPLEASKAPTAQFRVTFSQAVSGVDATDFAVNGVSAGIVTAVNGSGAVYTVTVDLNSEVGPAQLVLLDDGTIADTGGKPLGGPGAGNGGFTHNGPISYADPALDGPDDFDGAMYSLDRSLAPAAWMFGNQPFTPDLCDVNGGSISISPPGIVGNGMLDSFEEGVISACLENPALDCSATGGITHAIVAAAWQRNYAQMHSDLGGDGNRFDKMIPGVETLLAGMMTEGDFGSSRLPVLLMGAVSVFIQLPAGTSVPDPANYTLLGEYLGPNGDADGDGSTNRQEYDFFMPMGGRAMYVMAVLDPAMTPQNTCANSTGGIYNPGVPFCLSVPDPVNLPGGFEWRKDGVPLSNDAVLSGTHWRELHIHALRVSDSGDYTCVYDDGHKVFGPVNVTVREEKVPASGNLGLLAISAALALVGARVLRRCAAAKTAN